MALNLIELIKACGSSGLSGQSFDGHVTGTTSGTKMSDYRVTSMEMGVIGFNNSTYFTNWTTSITRGPRAYEMPQRTDAGAWSCNVSYVGGGYSGWSWSSFSTSAIGNGGSFSQSITLVPAANTSMFVNNVILTFNNGTGYPNPAPPYNQYYNETWSGYHAAQYYNQTPGNSTYNIALSYDPDSASFNPVIYYDRNVIIENRAPGATTFNWYNNYTDAQYNFGSSAGGYLGTGASLPWESYNQSSGLNRTVYGNAGDSGGIIFYSDVSQYDYRQDI